MPVPHTPRRGEPRNGLSRKAADSFRRWNSQVFDDAVVPTAVAADRALRASAPLPSRSPPGPAAAASGSAVVAVEACGGGGRKPQLAWSGRWGCWRDDAVHILAPNIAELEVLLSAGVPLPEALQDIRGQMVAMVAAAETAGRPMVHVVDNGTTNGRHRVRAVLTCSRTACQELCRSWQGRPICGGSGSVATWLSTVDTTTREHVAQVKSRWDPAAAADSVSLELPAKWTMHSFPAGNCCPLSPESHWYRFATVFGAVLSVELAWRSPGDTTVQLLIRFHEASSAGSFHELLTGRYLWNPLTQGTGDVHAAVCSAGRLEELRSRALMPLQGAAPSETEAARPLPPAPPEGPTGPVFQLRRLNGPASEIRVAPWRPSVSLGREDSCDLAVRSVHVSRQHLHVRLLGQTDGQTPWMLFIEDRSTNGTWVNSRRMVQRQLVQVSDGDRISFEAAGDPTAPVYGVRRFPDDATASAVMRGEASYGGSYGSAAPRPPVPAWPSQPPALMAVAAATMPTAPALPLSAPMRPPPAPMPGRVVSLPGMHSPPMLSRQPGARGRVPVCPMPEAPSVGEKRPLGSGGQPPDAKMQRKA